MVEEVEIVVVLVALLLGLVAVYWPRRAPRRPPNVIFRNLKWEAGSNEQTEGRVRGRRRRANGQLPYTTKEN